MRMKKILMSGLTSLCVGSLVYADTLVHWGGDYVTGSRVFDMPTAVNDGGVRTFPYSAVDEITPTTDYTVPTDRSGPIYGALETDTAAGANFIQNGVFNSGTTDFIQLGLPSGTNGTISGLIFFVQEDFLNGSDVTLSLEGMAGSVDIREINGTGSFRLAVQNSGSWYLSASSATAAGSFAVSDMGAVNWGAWNPTSSPLGSLPGTYDVSGATLTDVEAVGFYFEATRTSSARVGVNEFIVTGSVVPEPASLGLLIAGAVILSLRRRASV